MQPIKATIHLDGDELMELLNRHMLDRHTAMVQKYGEACTKTTAGRIISCSVQTINAMLADGRILAACGGQRVDVRSLADYIENRGEKDQKARQSKRGNRKYV